MLVRTEHFGTLPDGTGVNAYVLDNGRVRLRAIDYGAIITALHVPDRHGNAASIVLGHAALEPYLTNPHYLGAVVGRYANRIRHGRFMLDGHVYQLAVNDGSHHLHGGRVGFDRHVWAGTPAQSDESVGVVFSRRSPDGEEGYPGDLQVRVSYELSRHDGHDDVSIAYSATTTAPTIVNLTQHSYFDLSSGRAHDVLGHELTIDASSYVPVDSGLIPLGTTAAVAGTPFDFRASTGIGTRIGHDDPQLARGRGYDHCWVLNGGGGLARAAHVAEPTSGRTLEVWTTEPGVQFYSGNLLDGRIAAGGRALNRHTGFCLETQHMPDSPNIPVFPSTTLVPAAAYSSRTVWRLGCAR